MFRRLITIGSALSLALCAIVTILWLLTYLRYDSINFELPNECGEITNRWGRIRILYNLVPGPRDYRVTYRSRGWLHADNYHYFLHNEPVVPWIHVVSGYSIQLPHWVLVVALGAGGMQSLLRRRKRRAKPCPSGADAPIMHVIEADHPTILTYGHPVARRLSRYLIAAAVLASLTVTLSVPSLRGTLLAPFVPQSPNDLDPGNPDLPAGWGGEGILLPTDDFCGT